MYVANGGVFQAETITITEAMEVRRKTNVEILRTSAASKYLDVSPWKLRQLVKAGKISFISEGDNTSPLRFLVSDLDAYIAKCRVPANA
jgi:microsomal dipeptidase-like Zn-dependent dipeptidase